MPNPSKRPRFSKRYIVLAEKLCQTFAATHEELAAFIDVDVETLHSWIEAHPEFERAIWRGNLMADAALCERLYRRGIGYSRRIQKAFFPEGSQEPVYVEVEQYYPPDVEVQKFWLCNRQPKKWRDVFVRGEMPLVN